MARFTETLKEYLENGNTLPSAFDDIKDFEDFFKMYYCDKEIGFETETIFAMKLEMYANIVIPAYKDRIDRITAAWENFDAPVKIVHDRERSKYLAGAQHGSTTELPINSTTAEPNVLQDNDEYENKQKREIKHTEEGSTEDEAMRRVDFITKKVKLVMFELLQEFKPCFMNVY